MLTTWVAQRLEHVLEQGRTRPLVLNCKNVNGDDTPRSFVVKAEGLPEITPQALFNEVTGNLLASRLGIKTADPALIVLTEEFVNVINRDLGTALQPGIAAGAAFLSGLAPIVPSFSPSNEELDQMTVMYGFDMVVQNPDRRIDNPNCAYRAGTLIAYDFDMCFSFAIAIGRLAHPCAISEHGIACSHCFWSVLHNKRARISWAPLCSQLRGLSADELSQITSLSPSTWQSHAEKVHKHLAAICKDLDRLELELQGSLS